MTKIVYSAASPDVYSPPPGVVVLPLEQHPAFVAESQVEKLPPGEKRSHNTLATLLQNYFRTHPPADTHALAAALNATPKGIKTALLNNPQVFKRVGKILVGEKGYRVLWTSRDGLPVTTLTMPDRAHSAETHRIHAYLQSHGPATKKVIAEALGLGEQKIKSTLEQWPKLFRRVARVKGNERGARLVLWGVVTQS